MLSNKMNNILEKIFTWFFIVLITGLVVGIAVSCVFLFKEESRSGRHIEICNNPFCIDEWNERIDGK